MDVELKRYLDSGKYLPAFMEDGHDQKDLFKRLNKFVQNRENDPYTKDVDWMAANVYTVDIFLWYMAAHGYTLQKSRKKVPFYNIDNDLAAFRESRKELHKQIWDKFQKDRMNKTCTHENVIEIDLGHLYSDSDLQNDLVERFKCQDCHQHFTLEALTQLRNNQVNNLGREEE